VCGHDDGSGQQLWGRLAVRLKELVTVSYKFYSPVLIL